MPNPPDDSKNKEFESIYSSHGKVKYQCVVRPNKSPDKLETISIEARSFEEAIEKLQRDHYLIISIHVIGGEGKKSSGFFGIKFPSAKTQEISELIVEAQTPSLGQNPVVKPQGINLDLFSRVSQRELISFAIQLSALLKGGIPLLKGLQISQKGTQNRYFKSILEGCIKNVTAGFSFSYAIKSFPKVFSSVWCNLVEVGETSGTLPDVLREIAHYQDAALRLKSKVISAFFYPCILIGFATLAVGFLLLNIIPKFAEMFEGMNMELPVVTKIVIAFSRILTQHFLIFILLIVAILIGIYLARKTKQGIYVFDLLKLRMPIMGNLMLQVAVVRFGRGLATMLRAGVPILQALELSSKLTVNAVAEEKLGAAYEAIKGGRSLSAQLESDAFFPPFMTQLISVGEETGELDRFLDLISNYYEESIDTFLARLTTLLEPLLLIGVGSVIGVLVISMILPIIELSTSPNLG
jgi:type II secretory pathway component PulF